MQMLKPNISGEHSSSNAKANLSFTKMQALGNDFVLLDEAELVSVFTTLNVKSEAATLSKLAVKLCDRHFGVGADGLIIVGQSKNDCDLSWTYINSDGSTSAMCGNGIRCLAFWAVEKQIVKKNEFNVSTAKGAVGILYESALSIQSDLGLPLLNPAMIPVAEANAEPVVRKEFSTSCGKIFITCVGMGNPHCVIFNPAFSADSYGQVASELQKDAYFPQGVNVEFVRLRDSRFAEVIVYERGCGLTLACASGAAAVLVAGVLEGCLEREATVRLPGGDLQISWSGEDHHVRICGPANISFTGTVDLSPFKRELCQP
ncbi:MAG: diaminopimelate epimerase [Candidatus Obscuribacterales bacterium]|nr:diaminopimelate epimerase [Candidatus Obscuribacterales bacterium]